MYNLYQKPYTLYHYQFWLNFLVHTKFGFVDDNKAYRRLWLSTQPLAYHYEMAYQFSPRIPFSKRTAVENFFSKLCETIEGHLQ